LRRKPRRYYGRRFEILLPCGIRWEIQLRFGSDTVWTWCSFRVRSVEKLTYLTMDQIEEQAISDTKVAAPTGTFSEVGSVLMPRRRRPWSMSRMRSPSRRPKPQGMRRGVRRGWLGKISAGPGWFLGRLRGWGTRRFRRQWDHLGWGLQADVGGETTRRNMFGSKCLLASIWALLSPWIYIFGSEDERGGRGDCPSWWKGWGSLVCRMQRETRIQSVWLHRC
jgi:hypothetical protein